MISFRNINPVVNAVYFLLVTTILMISENPIFTVLSIIGAVTVFIMETEKKEIKTHIYSLGLFVALSLINPLVSHNGVTVLFVMNDTPVTLEAFLYGIFSAGTIVAILYWFKTFSQIMTSDKLLYIFGKLSPKLSLIISMALRYVPLFTKQWEKISNSQKALGIYREDNIIDFLRAKVRIFSVMVTWTLENGIITADSMSARGYGTGKRTYFSEYKFRKTDIIFMILSFLLFSFTLISVISGEQNFKFYPRITTNITTKTIAGNISYMFLIILPVITETEERIKWRYLTSKI